jgi:DNA-binding XRE family transcriptional regulator
MKQRTTTSAERLTLDLMTRLQTAQVAGRMRSARIEAGLTQEQMAELIGVHKRVIENVENNRLVKGPYQYINAWSDVSNWSVRRLLHGEAMQPGEDEDGLADLRLYVERLAEELGEMGQAVARIEALLQSRANAS